MTHISKKESIKEYTLAQLREKERAELEAKRNALLDEIKQLEDKLQKLTDKFVKDIDALVEEKSKEILTV